MSEFLAEYVDGGPGCSRDDCQLSPNGPGMVTAAYYAPVWDKNGNNLNLDMNINTSSIRCLSCGKTWTEQMRNGI
jgi:hypothetical protein